ncbi:eukaryotic translation initiation factor 5B-like [Aethina tumida]|uniref:eukaryotic translation initiation factor 5B-like n=1 Tax=Aethina tumida TaxID=116153 RepID=UPI0021479355|nr:eukaryotic translation initiation factor 5B-like [Aethina tumida]
MGKAKKQGKRGKGDESESETEVESQELIDKANGKKGKAGKNKTEDTEDVKKEKKPKGKKDKQVDDDEIEQSMAALKVEDEENSDSDLKVKKKSDERTNKKGKKARRKRDDSDEDIEKVLAELELEYSGVKKEEPAAAAAASAVVKEDDEEQPEEKKKSKKKEKVKEPSVEKEEDKDDEGVTIKTAAQKKKEKKEREKQKKLAAKKTVKQDSVDNDAEPTEAKPQPQDAETKDNEAEDGEKDSKKKKKKGKDKEEKETKDAKKGPGKKTIAAMQEAIKKRKEEEERLRKELEEQERREEEAEKARLEAIRLEQERKEKKKQKEKERKERLKAEGKLLTAKQKADRARAQALIDSLKAQGVALPDVGERKPRLGTRVRPNKQKKESAEVAKTEEESKVEEVVEQPAEKVEEVVKEKDPEDDIKDAWDASSDEEESEETAPTSESKVEEEKQEKKQDEEDSSTEEESDEDDESEGSESDDDDDDGRTQAEKARDRAIERIKRRKEEAEKNRTVDNLRAAIVCVLGHVDTGKTKILDKLRRTNVQDGEAGGITQQIGATNVPIEAIKEQIKIVKGASEMDLKVPGLLIIDTPGHESFSNLRNRGSSLCDIAILVVDIMHGLEPQTIESINILKSKKTPFIVALNKIDRLYDWQTMNRKDVRDILKAQASNTQLEFEQRTKDVILQFAEQGLNAALFYENPDIRSYVSLVPTSAITGEGMGNLLALIVEFCQTKLPKRLMYSDELQATVLEVKAIPGLGTTIDVILVNGTLREGDTMLCAGTDGPIVTQIRSLLMPQPLRELRVKNAYVEYREIKAAQGVKIAAKELEKAIAGLNLYVAQKPDEVDVMKDEVAKELRSALSNIKLVERGVYVQASTLGSLEALLEFLRTSKIPYSGIRIGPVVKKDVMKASIMLEHESQYATILAFDVKVERDAQELADSLGVKIFQADIIYHLFDKFTAYREELKQRKREEFKHIAVFPCKVRILPQFVFNSRDPIVVGVMVEAGIIKEGTPICVPSKEFLDLGVVTSIESNHKPVETARKGMEVCIKIEPVPGEAPKMFGRHFDETDMLTSKISRQSIDACKDYFRDDLLKTDWQLMVELKKLFQIL